MSEWRLLEARHKEAGFSPVPGLKACWRNVVKALGVSLAPGLMGTAVTSKTWTLLWDRGAVDEQRSHLKPGRCVGHRRLRQEKNQERERTLNIEEQITSTYWQLLDL